ncbi:MAG: hypothetical protein ACLQVN_04085 [Bryobacteraceae bacterium]
MNQHLTERQILECVAGMAETDSRRHLGECPACGAEVHRLEGAVRGFAVAAHRAASRPAPRLDWAAAPVAWAPAWRLAVAALALVLLAIPLMFHFNLYPNNIDNTVHTTAQSRQQQLERERADEALLEQVDRAVSRPVPQPIQPLVQLVAWGSKSNSGVTE